MKKFYFGGDGGDDEGDDEDMDMEGMHMPSPAELIAMTQVESPSRYLMDSAIRVSEKSFMWSLMSPDDKIAMIRKVFEALAGMIKEYEIDAEI